jgi:hypothetical protein
MVSNNDQTPPKKRLDRVARLLKKKYVQTKKIGDKWNTYLQIDHQGFCVVEQTTKKRAEWFGRMLATALTRVSIE